MLKPYMKCFKYTKTAASDRRTLRSQIFVPDETVSLRPIAHIPTRVLARPRRLPAVVFTADAALNAHERLGVPVERVVVGGARYEVRPSINRESLRALHRRQRLPVEEDERLDAARDVAPIELVVSPVLLLQQPGERAAARARRISHEAQTGQLREGEREASDERRQVRDLVVVDLQRLEVRQARELRLVVQLVVVQHQVLEPPEPLQLEEVLQAVVAEVELPERGGAVGDELWHRTRVLVTERVSGLALLQQRDTLFVAKLGAAEFVFGTTCFAPIFISFVVQ